MKHKATWELKNIIKALNIMEVLNTNEENKRLNEAKLELKERKDKELWKYISNISWQVPLKYNRLK